MTEVHDLEHILDTAMGTVNHGQVVKVRSRKKKSRVRFLPTSTRFLYVSAPIEISDLLLLRNKQQLLKGFEYGDNSRAIKQKAK